MTLRLSSAYAVELSSVNCALAMSSAYVLELGTAFRPMAF